MASVSRLAEEPDGGAEVDEEEDHRRPAPGHVVVEDALHVAHGLLGWRADERGMERVAEQDSGHERVKYDAFFH